MAVRWRSACDSHHPIPVKRRRKMHPGCIIASDKAEGSLIRDRGFHFHSRLPLSLPSTGRFTYSHQLSLHHRSRSQPGLAAFSSDQARFHNNHQNN